MEWEARQFDLGVADAFGFHALQLGLPKLDALRANRIPQRWLACAQACAEPLRGHLACEFSALPFPDASIDLIVLPHTLEMSLDPHATLREADRVLVPEGRLILTGFNPASWCGLRRARRFGVPAARTLIGPWRLRDWLHLLSFEIRIQALGAYRPLTRSERWLQRWSWMDRMGPRWWPVLGGVYYLEAVKRVRGMRLLGPSWRRATPATSPAVASASRQRMQQESSE